MYLKDYYSNVYQKHLNNGEVVLEPKKTPKLYSKRGGSRSRKTRKISKMTSRKTGRKKGRKKGRFEVFIPPSAEDFVLHSIAFSDKNELKGKYLDTSRDNFTQTMLISCFSFTETAKEASKLMVNGGALVTLSYDGSQRVVPNYNVMGVAKAALESSVRYLATDLGGQNIRVNSLSAGPMKTLAMAGISGGKDMLKWSDKNSLMQRNITLEDVGKSGFYLLSDLSSGVTGENHYVDCGYNKVGVPREI